MVQRNLSINVIGIRYSVFGLLNALKARSKDFIRKRRENVRREREVRWSLLILSLQDLTNNCAFDFVYQCFGIISFYWIKYTSW